MAKRLSNSEKNRRAREKYLAKLARANQSNMDAVNKEIRRQDQAWTKPPGAGNDLEFHSPGGEVDAIFTPKKGGGGTYLTRDGAQTIGKGQQVPRGGTEEALAATGGAGEARTGTTGTVGSDTSKPGKSNPLLEAAERNKGRAAGVGVTSIESAKEGEGNLLGGRQDMGPAQTPRNVGQWLGNLLNIGGYATARAGEGVADAINAGEERAKSGEAGPLSGTQTLAETFAGFAGGAARGAAEGLGFRFDDEKPKTWSQNLNDAGLDKTLRENWGDELGGAAAGTIGFAADVALDPTTYLTLGASGVGKGIVRGAEAAAANATTKLGKASLGAAGAVKGAFEGAAQRRAELGVEAMNRSVAREVQKDANRLSPEEFSAKWGGEDYIAADATAGDGFYMQPGGSSETFLPEAPAKVEPTQLALPAGSQPKLELPATASDYRPRADSVEQVQSAARLLNPVLRETDELLPSLKRAVTPKVDGAAIVDAALANGTRKVTVPLLAPEAVDTIATVSQRMAQVAATAPNPAQLSRAVKGAMGTLEANSAIAARLDFEVNDGVTLRELIEAAFRGHKASQRELEKLGTRTIDEEQAGINTPALREAIDQILPGVRDALGISGSKLHRLTYRLGRTTDPEAQRQILRDVLGKTYEAGYSDFRAALAGAASGELPPEALSSMVAALGLKTRAVTPAGLMKVLTDKGVTTYEAALAQIPTPEQVNLAFNITPRVQAEMARVDVPGVQAEAADAADEVIAATPGAEEIETLDVPTTNVEAPAPKPEKAPKPPVMPARAPAEFTSGEFDAKGGQALNPVGKAAYAGVRALGKLLKDSIDGAKSGNTLTSYTDQVSTAVHKAVSNELKFKYLQKGGLDRGERFLPRWLEAMRVVEAWSRGKGMYPHLVDNAHGTGDIWVSSTQILGRLPEDVVSAAVFAPMKNRASAAAEASIGFVNGFTIYPNHIAAGYKLARTGASAEEIAAEITRRAAGASRGMQKGTDQYVKAFAETDEGQRAIGALADAMTDRRFLNDMAALDADVKPVAEAISQQYIENTVMAAGQRIMKVVREGGDRGTLMHTLREVDEWASASAKPTLLEADRISASVTERLNSAIVKGVLGEDGFLKAQHDWEFATAVEEIPASQRAARQAATLAREQARVRKTKAEAAKVTVPVQDDVLQRAKVAKAARGEALEAETTARATLTAEFQAAKGGPLTPEEELFLDGPVAESAFEFVGMRASGRFGARDLWGARVNAEEGTLAQSARYSSNLVTWVRGTSKRMSAELGRPVKPAEALEHLNGPIFRALAATDPALWGDRAALREALIEGRALPDTSGPALTSEPVAAGLSESDADLALELHRFLDHVFNPYETGMLGRSGLAARDVAKGADLYLGREFSQFGFDPNLALVDQATKWRAWSEASSPLDLLDRTHQSIQAAMVPQQIAHTMGAMFDHRTLRPGVPTSQLYAEGWRRVDVEKSPGVGKFVDPDAMFPPEVLSQIKYVDEFLSMSRGWDPEGFVGGFIVKPYDAITRVLKSSNTIWRPGHHVTNVLGEFGMLVMAGVNPMQAIRGIKTIRAGGGLLDADMAVLDDLARGSVGKKPLEPKFSGDTVRIIVDNGRGGKRIEEVPLATVWQRAVNSGAALTHTNARDLVQDVGPALDGGILANNPIAKTDQALGQFSATRDNVTRLAHFIDALERAPYRNLDDAFTRAAQTVHDYHPTVRTLSRWEQKYARRAIFFYTWMRQAVSRVLRTAMDRPGFATLPMKAQYNAAQAAGLNPESFAGPTSDDPRQRSYTTNSLIGPTGRDSMFPFSILAGASAEPQLSDDVDEATLAEDLWSMSFSAPQLDTLQALFGGFNATPGQDPYENLKSGGFGGAIETGQGLINPLLSIGPEYLAELQKYGSGKSLEEIIASSAGSPTAISRFLPSGSPDPETGGTRSVYSELFPTSSGADRTPEDQAEEMRRYLANWLTGLKFQNVTGGTAAEGAKRELRDAIKAELANQGITDPDIIDQVRDQVWQQRTATQLRG